MFVDRDRRWTVCCGQNQINYNSLMSLGNRHSSPNFFHQTVHRDMLVWLESLAFPVNLGDLVCPEVSSTMPMPVVKHVQPDHLEQLAQEVRLDQRGSDGLPGPPGTHGIEPVILDFPESWDLLDSPDYLDNHANRVALDRPALQGLRALLDPQDAKALLDIRPMRDSQATLGLLGRLANPGCRDILAYPAYLGHQDSTGRMANIAIVHREQHPKSNR
uniref:DDE_Tnp_Tn3 domain-containing protein n=1 Tax=Globodera pallida TaxID=36090 RepID=A0A183C4R5_GLOPA